MTQTTGSYGQAVPPMATVTPTEQQAKTAKRQESPLKGISRGFVNSITVKLIGQCRRISDGALYSLSGKLDLDHFGTLRTWIYVPINPDAGGLTGNTINAVTVSPEGSAWIGACGTVSPNEADKAWTERGICGQITDLMRGKTMCTGDGVAWEIVVTDTQAEVYAVNVSRD